MLRSMLKVMAATAAFGVVHSLLASRATKRAAARTVGERNRDGLYRLFYNAQSALAFGALVLYVRRQPDRELYRVRGLAALLMHAGQAAALVQAVAATRQIGVGRFLGLESLRDWLGDGPVSPAPDGQGPALDDEGLRRAAGPFAWSRHPLNFTLLPLLWLWPRMTTNLLAFNLVVTGYVVLGSLYEEARLREAYGEEYADYQRSGVAFFIPRPDRSPLEPMGEVVLPEAIKPG